MNIAPSGFTELPNDVGTLVEMVAVYEQSLAGLQNVLDQALIDVETNPSDPGALARYQAAMADYTTFKQWVSTLIKSYFGINSSTLRNVG